MAVRVVDNDPASRRSHLWAIGYTSAESLANKFSDGKDSPELREKDRTLCEIFDEKGPEFKSRLDRQPVPISGAYPLNTAK